MEALPELLTEQEAAVYDRQIRVWGVDAQRRLSKARVLVRGMTGVVAEACKNIVLAGVGSLTLIDSAPVTSAAAQSNFLIPWDEVDSGKTIANVCADSLRDFNPLVNVSVETGDIVDKPEEFWDDYDAVVLGQAPLDLRIRINTLCRQRPHRIAFYSVECRGSCGIVFVDLQAHSYTSKKKVDDKDSVQELSFPSLQEALSVRWETLPKRTTKLFFAMRVVEEFELAKGKQLSLGADDVSALLAFSTALCQAQGVSTSLVPESLLERLTSSGRTELPPVCAIIGGILGQEIVRAVSQKGEPLRNYFFFDPRDGKGIIEAILPPSAA